MYQLDNIVVLKADAVKDYIVTKPKELPNGIVFPEGCDCYIENVGGSEATFVSEK